MKKVESQPRNTKHSPLTLSRSHVLGGIYARCERLAARRVAVYLNDASGEELGLVDESHGRYADAFTFFLSEANCELLARGKFDYSFAYKLAEPVNGRYPPSRQPIRLISVHLIARETHDASVSTSPNAPVVNEPPADPISVAAPAVS